MPADLRSDTLTRPSAAMLEAIACAEVGDDVFGEDPTVNRLQVEAAHALGMAAALFVPSGTMANQCAIHVHCRPGDEVICDSRSHVTRFEAGGIARWTGASVREIQTADGFPTVAAIDAVIQPNDDHLTRSRLLVLENTHNMAGGTVLGLDGMRTRIEFARSRGLVVHLDGARIANAAVALGCGIADVARGVDSVSMCFSKGLGAPVGSVVAGSTEFVRAARRVRKAFGGGMRQAGLLAAAARVALRDGPQALATDHARARQLAVAFAVHAGMRVTEPASNIVMLDLDAPRAAELSNYLAARDVLALPVRPDRLRFVTHRDLDDAAIDTCIAAVAEWARDAENPNP